MKKAFKIFLRDIKRVGKNALAMIIAVGISVIPAMYAWFNIAANWDPYGSTNGISVAVANCDNGYNLTDTMSITIGDQIVENLKANNQIGWKFVSKDDALNGTESGKYYASVIIPEDFSKNIISFLSDDIQTPKIEYYVNEKKNAIAPKITDKCVETIQSQVNETFIDTVAKTVANILNEATNDGENPIETLKNSLGNASNDLAIMKSGIISLEQTTESLSSLSKNVQTLLPQASGLASETSSAVTDLQTVILYTKDSTQQVTESSAKLLDNINAKAESIKFSVSELEELAQKNNLAAYEKINSIADKVENIVSTEVKISQIIHSLTDNIKLPDNIQNSIDKFDKNINNHRKLLSDLREFASEIKEGNFSKGTAEKINKAISKMQNEIGEFDAAFSTKIKPSVDKTFSSFYSVLGKTAGILDSLAQNKDIQNTLTSADKASQSGNNSLQNAETLLTLLQNKIDSLISDLDKLSNSEIAKKISSAIQNNPDSVGKFISSPTEIEINSLYPIENYGSAMTPFYSVLAIWVGCIVLVAILKVDVDEDDKIKAIKPREAYLGRYLYFMMLSLIQTTVICLGDLYFLQIQCPNPFLFVLAGWIISIVFSNIVYTLTVSFGDIGKALAVILLVLQIAGSGGTFPIEVTPEFFQGLYHFLPFTYAIDAMRETIGGLYGNNYALCLLKLFAFVPLSLCLGLFLRNPLIKFKNFFRDKVESTHIM